MRLKKLLAQTAELVNTVVKYTEELVQTVNHDRICGAWVAEVSDHEATIVPMNVGYMAAVYRRGRLVEQLFVLPKGETLEINGCAGTTPVLVGFDPETQVLSLGRYGRFRREHDAPGEEFDIMDYLPDPPPTPCGVKCGIFPLRLPSSGIVELKQIMRTV
jgi:hypothetical protein